MNTSKMIGRGIIIALVLMTLVLLACNREEVALSDIAALRAESDNVLIANTIYKPGPPKYETGKYGGTIDSYVDSGPKSFNTLNARDGETAKITDHFYPSLFDYDPYKRAFVADYASFTIEYDEEKQKTYVIFTLRDDIFWTAKDGTKEKITTDDVVFWYDEVEGDKATQNPGYPGQFIKNAQGEKERVLLEKIDELSAKFIIPAIIADPALSTNMSFGPRYLFEPAKKSGGVSAMLDLLSIDTNPETVPSAGKYMLSSYTPGQVVVLERNPDFWKKDSEGNRLPYIDSIRYRIIKSEDAALLSFQEGDLTSYGARPEDLDSLIEKKTEAKEEKSYEIYSRGTSLGSAFITFNQNPNTMPEYKNKWFKNKYFRQAMSSLIPRERLVEEVYRGLGEPAYHFFAKPNPFYDENISLEYRYSLENAKALLIKAGFQLNDESIFEDADGNILEFDFNLGVSNAVAEDIAQLFSEEGKKIGVIINVKPIDFQTLVEKLTKSYKWDAVMVALGSNFFPSSGSNVWQSSGNFHLWYPLQTTPATEWEARIDELYLKGISTIDTKERKIIYDEYQNILLDELPVIYLIHSESFVGYRNTVQNLFFDNLEGSKLEFLYFKE